VVNAAQHTYWNLAGHAAGPILDHRLRVHAERYTPGDPVVPTGEIQPVKGTSFDFTTAKPIGRDLKAAGGTPTGYDLNYVVDGPPGTVRPVARVEDPTSGRVLTIESDQPGVQFYTGNFLDGSAHGKGGVPYRQYGGLCLETQAFPNSVNVPAWQPQLILRPGKTYRHAIVYRFSTE
jgi:aldose 1-epimerase